MPIRSGAMQRPRGCRCGNTLRQRYDEVGLPCSNTMGSPSPTSTNAISLPRTRRRCFWYGNAAEIMIASPVAGASQACWLGGLRRPEVPIRAVRNHRLTWLEMHLYAVDLHRDDIRLERHEAG